MTNQTKSKITHTGRFDSLGDELVVFPGIADNGDAGWFTARQMIRTGDDGTKFVLNTPMIFHTSEANALGDLASGYYARFLTK